MTQIIVLSYTEYNLHITRAYYKFIEFDTVLNDNNNIKLKPVKRNTFILTNSIYLISFFKRSVITGLRSQGPEAFAHTFTHVYDRPPNLAPCVNPTNLRPFVFNPISYYTPFVLSIFLF